MSPLTFCFLFLKSLSCVLIFLYLTYMEILTARESYFRAVDRRREYLAGNDARDFWRALTWAMLYLCLAIGEGYIMFLLVSKSGFEI